MKNKFIAYLIRFTVIYALVYWVIGSISYQIFDYSEALETMEYFELWRPLENITMVIVVFLGSIIRAAIIGTFFYPFYRYIVTKKTAWLMIFAVLFGFCVLGSHLFMQNALADIGQAASWSDYFADFKYGVPELILQLLTFSIIFTALEKRKQNKNNKAATAA